jgi:hypothetical protein
MSGIAHSPRRKPDTLPSSEYWSLDTLPCLRPWSPDILPTDNLVS